MGLVKLISFYLTNPYRIVQQIKYKKFLHNNPGVPWMAPNVISFLDKTITSDFKLLEWGSGGSTQWFASRCSTIISVENNKEWYDKVKRDLNEHGLKNVDYRFVETNENVSQKDLIKKNEIPPYVKLLNEFEKDSLDLVIVDGSFRHVCIDQVPSFIKPGGYLLLDNSNWCNLEDWGIPKDWPQVAHHDVGVSCTTVWQKTMMDPSD